MKVLIFVLFALAVDAHTYWSNNPSWGYGSSLYGSSYGSGLGYGSGLSYGSGHSYGSGLGYSSGIGSGSYSYSPITYQTASVAAQPVVSYTTAAVKPAVAVQEVAVARPATTYVSRPVSTVVSQPAVSYIQKPAVTYSRPAVSYVAAQPAVSYVQKPAVSYVAAQPAVSYVQKPAVSYVAAQPAVSYVQKQAVSYVAAQPAVSYVQKPAVSYVAAARPAAVSYVAAARPAAVSYVESARPAAVSYVSAARPAAVSYVSAARPAAVSYTTGGLGGYSTGGLGGYSTGGLGGYSTGGLGSYSLGGLGGYSYSDSYPSLSYGSSSILSPYSYGSSGHSSIWRKKYQEPVHATDYSYEGAPENIAFAIGDGAYQTGKSAVSGIDTWNSPIALRSQKTVPQSIVQMVKSVEAPQRVMIAQDYKGSRQLGLHGSGGVPRVSSFQKTIAPATVFSERDSSGIRGSLHDTAHNGAIGDVAGVQEIDGIGGHVSTTDVADAGYVKTSPVAAYPKPSPVFHQRTTPIRRTGTQSSWKNDVAPGKITFTQDFSGVIGSGQSNIHGAGEISTLRQPMTPIRRTGIPSSWKNDVAPGKITFTQDFSRVIGSGQSNIHGAGEISTLRQPTTPIRRTGIPSSWKNDVAPGKITFTQDFSQVIGSGQSHLHGTGGISTLRQPIAPPRIVLEKPAEILPQRATPFRHRGSQGTAAGVAPGKISFTQDFSGLSGQSALKRTGGNAGILSLPKPVAPARIIPERLPYQKPTYTRNYVPGKAPGHISFTLGGTGYETDKSAISGVREWSSPVVPRPSSGQRNIGTLPRRTAQEQPRRTVQELPRRTAQELPRRIAQELPRRTAQEQPRRTVSEAGPARISFTQDFSKVTSHQTSGHRQVVPTLDKFTVPAYPGAISSGIYEDNTRITHTAPKSVQRPVISTPGLKASKQPISQEPALTTIYEQSPAEGVFGGSIGHIQSTAGGIGDQRTYYTGDKSNILMGIPAAGYSGDKSSALSFSSGVNPAGGFVEEKGSVYQLPSGILDSAALQGYQGQDGYSAVSTPFKSYYSNSYPSYSQLSGESPRFEFSPDRSLLYTYSSPYVGSPFSYTYSSGKAQYGQLQKKAA